jgi:hypothetical protein
VRHRSGEANDKEKGDIPVNDRKYGVGEIARICEVGRMTVNRWMANSEIPWSFNSRGHKIVTKQNLVEFLRGKGMLYALQELGSFTANILVCSNSELADAIDDFVPEHIGVYAADEGLDVPYMMFELVPTVVVLDGRYMSRQSINTMAQWMARRSPGTKIIALESEDWVSGQPLSCDFKFRHPVVPKEIVKVIAETICFQLRT